MTHSGHGSSPSANWYVRLPTSTPQTTKSCPAATKPVQRAKRKLSTLKAQLKRIRCIQSQQRSYENERKEKQYRRRSRQTKKLQDERDGDQTSRYRFHLKSAQHTARLPRQVLQSSLLGLSFTATPRMISLSATVTRTVLVRSATISGQFQGRIQGFNPQIHRNHTRNP
jgi:hypothetical protein